MKLLVLVGSNQANSINRQLADYAASLSGYDYTVIDMLRFDETPLYSSQRQQSQGFPAEIQELYAQIRQHDALIIASPEHNGSIPAVFKNVIDWLSRLQMKFLGNKPVLLMSTSPGANGGKTNLAHMAQLLPWWGAASIQTYSLGGFYQVFDAEAQSLQQPEASELKSKVLELNAQMSGIVKLKSA